jgi:hypothetical protein
MVEKNWGKAAGLPPRSPSTDLPASVAVQLPEYPPPEQPESFGVSSCIPHSKYHVPADVFRNVYACGSTRDTKQHPESQEKCCFHNMSPLSIGGSLAQSPADISSNTYTTAESPLTSSSVCAGRIVLVAGGNF